MKKKTDDRAKIFFSFLFNPFFNSVKLISLIKACKPDSSKKIIFFSMAIIFLGYGNIFALTELSGKDMKKKVASSGISIGIKGAVLYNQNSSITLIDTKDTNSSYIRLNNIQRLSRYSTGDIDLDSDGKMNHLEIDIIKPQQSTSSYSSPFVSLKCNDWGNMHYIDIEEIDFNGHKIGNIHISQDSTPKWNLFLGAHNSGVDMEFGLQKKTSGFKFNYGTPSNNYYLGFTNFFLAEKFINSAGLTADPTNPATWNASGKFTAGNFQQNNPATIDIGMRLSDTSPIISISAPMSGSIRMGNLHIQDKDFGPAAIDGIVVHKMTIEIPGRDLGDI